MDVACQCGTVSFRTAVEKPLAIYFCHCTQCQKQSSSAFGISATVPADAIPLADASFRDKLDIFSRPTKTGGTMKCYFCRVCGSRVFHRRTNEDGVESPTLNIKGGLIEDLDTSNAWHIWTQEAVVPVPEGAVRWEQSPPPNPPRQK